MPIVLRAYYRKNAEGGSDISRLDALGNVRIVSAGETAYGDSGVYDVDQFDSCAEREEGAPGDRSRMRLRPTSSWSTMI